MLENEFYFFSTFSASVCPRSGKIVHRHHLLYRKKIRACLLVTDIIKMGADVTAIDFRSKDSFFFFFSILFILYFFFFIEWPWRNSVLRRGDFLPNTINNPENSNHKSYTLYYIVKCPIFKYVLHKLLLIVCIKWCRYWKKLLLRLK